MKKQEEMKHDIRILTNLTVSSLSDSRASAESKQMDRSSGLEAGLARIGSIIQNAERQIAFSWAEYVGENSPTIILYPSDYTLQSKEERTLEAEKLVTFSEEIPSVTYRKESLKRAAELTIASNVGDPKMNKIKKEIDAAEMVNVNVENLQRDVELGIVDPETAAKIRGYAEGTAEKAEEARIRRLTEVALAQSAAANDSAARGTDPDPTDTSAVDEKKETRDNSDTESNTDG